MQYGPGLPEEYTDAAGQAGNTALPVHEARQLKHGDGPVLAVRYNTSGTYCFTCGKDRHIRLWNPNKGTLVKTYTGHGYEVRDVAVSQDNSQFASCGGDKQVFVWDVGTGNFIRKLRGNDSTINAVTFAAQDSLLVTAGYDQTVRIWDMKARATTPLQTLTGFKDSVTCVVVREWEILAAGVDGSVRRWDVRMGGLYTDELHHPMTSLAVSNDGLCILAGCLDSCLRLLDKASGQLLSSYRGHTAESVKMDACLTPSDAHVVGSSETGEVMYWDLVDANVVQSFQAHTGVVCSLAMHPNGRQLLTSSTDGVVKVWECAEAQ